MEVNIIHNMNCLTGLQQLPDCSIDCCVTSPPYFGLRDYGNAEQIGLEETPELFTQQLVNVFAEVKRVLKPEGTLWLNLGDSYSGSGKGIGDTTGDKWKQGTNKGTREGKFVKVDTGLKAKDLIGIPWMVAFALRNSGWYLRQDIIWHKPNPMPESVTDRCTKSHEYIFLLSKSSQYFFDAESIKTPMKDISLARMDRGVSESHKNTNGAPGQPPHSMNQARTNKKHKNIEAKGQSVHSMHKARLGLCGKGFEGHSGNYDKNGNVIGNGMANKKSVWTVTTKPFKEAHFATFPENLIVDCIKAGCPENGIVLDPFMGAGTTALVAKKLGRNYIGFELNADYLKIANDRLYNQIGLFQ